MSGALSDDDLGLIPAGTYEPKAVQDLLSYLGLDSAPRPEQDAAISDWLKAHPPGPMMTYSMKRNGFGHLL
jgi:hypothetical protein